LCRTAERVELRYGDEHTRSRAASAWRRPRGGDRALIASLTAEAHHSIAAVYLSRQERVEGVVTEFQFINPHPFVIVTVDDGGGSWRLEMDNRFELADIGMTSETLKPGDRVVVSGSLGRTLPRTLYIRQLHRPADGFRYEQVGSRPRVSTVPL
jgi:hypothetical protein